MFDLHRHDEFSFFDGFGKAEELAELAKSHGYTALGSTNHGNTNGLIQTYKACKKVGIKPILGCEGYFLPKYVKQKRGYHLILIAKNLQGYRNLNVIQYLGEKQKFYNPIWDFSFLEKYNEGLICTSGCIGGYLAQSILKGNFDLADKFIKKMKTIFEDDFYIEIQPYSVNQKGFQELVNKESIRLAKENSVKCVLTSDSHRGREEDFPTYLKMHEVAGHNLEMIEETYKERYMPLPDEMQKRFYEMHKEDFGENETKKLIKEMEKAIDEIEEKCENDYLGELKMHLPKFEGNAKQKIKNDVKTGLQKKKKFSEEYKKRAEEELEVIFYHGFEDYFLIVADYVNWAKNHGIVVGAGRGSVCNCLVAYALGITDVDSLLFDLDFRRFLRKDKNSFPDIDVDFETDRRGEVIDYLTDKYKGHASRICSYGLYKIDNLVNDLAKFCGLPTDKTIENSVIEQNKNKIQEIKNHIKLFIDEEENIRKEIYENRQTKLYNEMYDNIVTHFCKLFKKVRHIATHAAGVAITGGDIMDYTALRIDAEEKTYTCYDLEDIEHINVIKFDLLGLRTLSGIKDLREVTKVTCDCYRAVEDKKLLKAFREGETDGIFQFEKKTAKKILGLIECDCFNDVVAGSALNRPGPLSQDLPQKYIEMKKKQEKNKFYEYAKESYGLPIYQEQLQRLCVYVGGLTWGEADKMLKLMKHGEENAKTILQEDFKKNGANCLKSRFLRGCQKNGLKEEEAQELFDSMMIYSFVKGHALGYSLLSVEEMFYKINFPLQFWWVKLKYTGNENNYFKFCQNVARAGEVIFLPHVNYSDEKTMIKKIQNEGVLVQGLGDLKSVGAKAAIQIREEREKNGFFKSYDNFYDRCKSRAVTSKVIEILKEQGALEFNKKTYINRVIKYNSSLVN